MSQAHVCEEVVTKAQRILNSEENFYYVRATRKKILNAIVFNASKYIVDNKDANQVTRERVNR
ncbi:hypothetical protein DVH05_005822 [Phytophthora capsici]|nr:hypothetical protein DVH05_005822 [Phytophthora capsici]